MERLTRSKVKAAQNGTNVENSGKSKNCSETEEGSSSKDESQPQRKIMRRNNSRTKGELPKTLSVKNGMESVAAASEPSTLSAHVNSGQIPKGLVPSTNHYNATVIGTTNENDAYYGIFKVIARMSVSNKTKLPPNWTMRYGNKQARAGGFAAMALLRMSSSSKPVQLFAQFPTLRKFKINVEVIIPCETGFRITEGSCKRGRRSKGSTSEIVELEVTGEDTLEAIRNGVNGKIEGLSRLDNEFFFKYNYKKLGKTKMLKEFAIRANAELKLTFTECSYSSSNNMKCLAGGSNRPVFAFRTVDVESQQSRYKAISSTDSFRWFEDGMNLMGKCPRKECISNRKKTQGMVMDVVVCQRGYGVVELTPQNNKVKCPACKKGEFTPTNFLVSKGRALFRFKKMGPGNVVDQVLMEHLFYYDKMDYAMFDETQGRSSNYDYFEIITVKWHESPYHCVACGDELALKREGYFPRGCGHAYHQNCLPPRGQNCQVCEAPEWNEDEASSYSESLSSILGSDSVEDEAGTSQ